MSFIFLAIIVRNSGKSMVPLPRWGETVFNQQKLQLLKSRILLMKTSRPKILIWSPSSSPLSVKCIYYHTDCVSPAPSLINRLGAVGGHMYGCVFPTPPQGSPGKMSGGGLGQSSIIRTFNPAWGVRMNHGGPVRNQDRRRTRRFLFLFDPGAGCGFRWWRRQLLCC